MEAAEYPTFTSEDDLLELSHMQRVMLFVEGSPALSVTAVLWFLGVTGTFFLNYIEGTTRLVVLLIIGSLFSVSAAVFYFLLKKGQLEKSKHTHERTYLKRMGVKKPMRFLKEHPLHLAAYKEVMGDLHQSSFSLYQSESFRNTHAAAMLVFTGKDRYKSAPLIVSLMNERGLKSATEIAAVLDTIGDNPPVLNDGAL
jgi:hypothetical protein